MSEIMIYVVGTGIILGVFALAEAFKDGKFDDFMKN